MKYCSGGKFTMGSPAGEKGRRDSEAQVEAELSSHYWMAETECTQGQWEALMGNNPSRRLFTKLVIRGSGWNNNADSARCAKRSISFGRGTAINVYGFRVVLAPGQPDTSDSDRESATDKTIAEIKKLRGRVSFRPYLEVDLRYSEVTDAGLAHLKELTGLHSLNLSGTQFTDAGLVHLEGLTGLKVLNLGSTKFTDAGLVYFGRLTGLRTLILNCTKVTDARLQRLEGPMARSHLRVKSNSELRLLPKIGKMLRAYSRDNDGAYPPGLDHPAFMDEVGNPDLLKFKHGTTGEVARPWFLQGQTASSPPSEILLASPWVYMGKRAVTFCDGSSKILKEKAFQEQLAEILKAGGRELVK